MDGEKFFSITPHEVCVCVCVCMHAFVWACTHSQAFVRKCEFVYLCLQKVMYTKGVQPGATHTHAHTHTQTYKCRLDRNNSDLPRLSGSKSACHHASFLTPLLSQLLFHINLCISHHGQIFYWTLFFFLTSAATSRAGLHARASWEGSRRSFGQSAEAGETEE